MANNKVLTRIVLIALMASAVLMVWQYRQTRSELAATLEQNQLNVEVVQFTGLFIEKVLKANDTIDFETRLQLENAVRALKDEAILSQWRKFVESRDEIQAQTEVKNLLALLVKKLQK